MRHRLAPLLACLAAAAAAGTGPLAAEDAPPRVPVERFFHGRVVKVEGEVVELLYDFEDPAQLADFEAALPFRAIRTVAYRTEGGRLHLEGTGSLRHRAVFGDDCGASATFLPRRNRDFGFAVTEERESEVFTLYCVQDRYFSLGDGVTGPQNMIIKFLARDARTGADALQEWRYCGSRGPKPAVRANQAVAVSCGRTGMESRMAIGEWETKGREAGREMTAQQVAVYGYDAEVLVDDLVVRGRLDPAFVERHRIDLSSWKPPPAAAPEAPAGDAVPDAEADRVRARIAGYPLDTRHVELAALLRDAQVPEALRAAGADRAIEVGDRRLVPYLVDGLYSDELASRRLAHRVLEALVGRDFGYRPEASEESRKKAIQALNGHLAKRAADFR